MVELEADQPMFTDPEWAVLFGGSYEPADLVKVYRVKEPDQIVAYHALYIATGVYP